MTEHVEIKFYDILDLKNLKIDIILKGEFLD
jgi:hypothetical protein